MSVPVAVKLPVIWSILNTEMWFEFWPATKRNCPPGAIAKLRGHFPRTDSVPESALAPVLPSVFMIAIESCPRLEPYTKRPFGCT